MGTTLVIGAKGKTGKRVMEGLIALKQPVLPASRSSAISFDWNDAGTWPAALKGIEKVYISFQPDLAVPGAVEIIRTFVIAAKKANVKKMVLLSGRGEKEAQECERIIMQSGIDWTIVRASWFMQNYSEGFFLESILGGHFVAPGVKAKVPLVDADDIAAVVVEALTNDAHTEKIYDLTGPELLSFGEAVGKISSVLKKEIIVQDVSIDEYVLILRNHHTPEEFIWLIKYLFTEVLVKDNESITSDVELVLKRKPTSFIDFVQKANLNGVWNTAN